MSNSVVLFDLWGTLLQIGDRGTELIPGVEELLDSIASDRLGVLTNAGAGRTGRDVLRELEHAGIASYFERELVITASDFPTPLPDRRAFAAAALADQPVSACVLVSRNTRLLIAAAAAGMKTVAVTDPPLASTVAVI
jgi:FMN phosphatase YigB (HAD superfamily)